MRVGEACTFTGAVVPEDKFGGDVPGGCALERTGVGPELGAGRWWWRARRVGLAPRRRSLKKPAGFGVFAGGARARRCRACRRGRIRISRRRSRSIRSTRGVRWRVTLTKSVTEEPSGFAGDLAEYPDVRDRDVQSRKNARSIRRSGSRPCSLRFAAESVTKNATEPVYNLSPNPGEVAKFGFSVLSQFDIQGNVSVRSGDYGLRVAFHNARRVRRRARRRLADCVGRPGRRNAQHVAVGSRRYCPWDGASAFRCCFAVAAGAVFFNPTSCGEPLEPG